MMAKDYKSFSQIAKTRFRGMAKELGYEQITGICYFKQRDGWYEGFFLQASQWGNDSFYINYGISVPNLWNPFETNVDLKNAALCLSMRLDNDGSDSFSNASKEKVAESAVIALQKYKEQALPWFAPALSG